MISIIVPFKNAEQWLERCFDSLTRLQGDFEFIVINDHSTDNSRVIAEQYAKQDNRFKVLDNEHAKGVSGARNTGLDYAKGEWLTFLDADDYLTEDADEAYKKALSVNADMHQLNHKRLYSTGRFGVKYYNVDGWYDIEHLPQLWCVVWNTLYRAERFGDIRFKEGLQYSEDELYNLECLAREHIVHNADVYAVVHCFNNPESLCKTKTEQELFANSQALEEFLARQTDPVFKSVICKIISDHWRSEVFMDIFTAPKTYEH